MRRLLLAAALASRVLRGAALRLLLAVAVASCAPRGEVRPRPPVGPPVEVPRVADDVGLADAERLLDDMDPAHPQRAAVRAAAQGYLLAQARADLGARRSAAAFDRFVEAAGLYAPSDMTAPARDDVGIVDAARRVRAAFAPAGAEEEVATALAVMATFAATRRDAEAADASGREMLDWLDEVAVLDKGPVARSARVVEVLEAVARDFPAPPVRDELTKRYLDLHAALGRALRHGLAGGEVRAMLGAHAAVTRLAYRLARLHLRADDSKRALELLRKLSGQPGDDAVLRERLARAAADGASAMDAVVLASHFEREDADVAERVCVGAARRDAKSADVWACAARLAGGRGDDVLAIARYERALALDPRREWGEALVKQRLSRLGELVSREKLGEAEEELRRIEAAYADAARRWPGRPLEPHPARAIFGLGRGYYWAGDLAHAEPLLERAVASGEAADGIEPLAAVRASRADAPGAAAIYGDWAAKSPPPWNARLLRRRAEALGRAGKTAEATDAWRGALALWDAMLRAGADGEAAAEIELERARVLHSLGERDGAFRAIDRSIEAAPDRAASYVDAVAFLATRGELEEALDVYLRTLGIEDLDDYAKIYLSAWVWDLARRSGGSAEVAWRYLSTVEGTEWHHEIARFASGRVPYDEALRRATTRGRRAEVQFYQAQNRWAAGKTDEARALWREVVASDMLAFYEYEMARYYLQKFEK